MKKKKDLTIAQMIKYLLRMGAKRGRAVSFLLTFFWMANVWMEMAVYTKEIQT